MAESSWRVSFLFFWVCVLCHCLKESRVWHNNHRVRKGGSLQSADRLKGQSTHHEDVEVFSRLFEF